MKLRKLQALNNVTYLLLIFFINSEILYGQGVQISTDTYAKKEKKIKLISDVKIPLEGDGTNYDVKIIRGRDDFELSIRRKDKKEREIFDKKGKKIRTEVVKEEDEKQITITSSKSYSPMLDSYVGNKIINFPNGARAEVPLSHDLSFSPNQKYVLSFPGFEPQKEDWFIRLYDERGKILWEYFDVFCPDSDAEMSHIQDFPVFWSPDGNFLAFVIEGRNSGKICLFGKKGFEWSYKSQDGRPLGITIARGGKKVIFGIRPRLTMEKRMIGKEMREKGFEAWNPIVPVIASCLNEKGGFLWKKEFLPASLHFSEDGRYFFSIRTTEKGGKIQILDADNGNLLHDQILKDWYEFAEKGRIRDLALDAERKNLAMLIEERLVEGIEWHEYMGGTYLKRTGPTKRRDLGYRLVVYDLSEILIQ